MKRIIILSLLMLCFNLHKAQETTNKQGEKVNSAFVEKSRFMITENKDRTLNFKNLGGNSSGMKMNMSLNGGGMSFGGFYAGTLLIIGESGLTLEPADLVRAAYKIECTHKVQKGAIIEIHLEGNISPNLKYLREGIVVTSFTIKDTSGKVILSNERTIEVQNRMVQKVNFKDETKVKELTTTNNKKIDFKSVMFDLK